MDDAVRKALDSEISQSKSVVGRSEEMDESGLGVKVWTDADEWSVSAELCLW